jgi:hypothetical protein
MIKQQIIGIVALISTVLLPACLPARQASQAVMPLLSPVSETREEVLAEHFLDLNTRSESETINEVFKFNVLHALAFFGDSFVLEPGEVFAFHDNVLPEFKDFPLKTGWTRYTAKEGYQTILGLPGNGVCHLASLMNWTASDAGLGVVAKVNHNFAPIPEMPKENGTSIKYLPSGSNSQNQNLYIKNTFDFPVKFVFETSEDSVNLKILKI